MRLWLALALFALAGDALAANRGAPGQTMRTGAAVPGGTRKVLNACLVPDIQNIVSQDDGGTAATGCTIALGCTGAYCSDSIYCDTTWQNTGRRILRNLAYDLTSQWSRIDWTDVRGFDTAAKNAPTSDRPPCDVIIGLGDNYDVLDGTGNPTYAGSSAEGQRQVDVATEFWQIIKASGIPFIIARGNHDPELIFRGMLTALNVSGLSYYVGGTEDQYAIKINTSLGKQLCVMTQDDDFLHVAGDTLSAGEIAWVTANTGCGTDLPTIVARHEAVDGGGALTAELTTLIGTASADEVFLLVGGHFTPNPPTSVKSSTTNLGGKTVWKFFSDWQEMDRHPSSANTPYGVTPSDGCGGMYTVLRVDAYDKTITAWDWNPYYMTRSTPAQCEITPLVSTLNQAFDFTARYP